MLQLESELVMLLIVEIVQFGGDNVAYLPFHKLFWSS